jgi:hypothetical protein
MDSSETATKRGGRRKFGEQDHVGNVVAQLLAGLAAGKCIIDDRSVLVDAYLHHDVLVVVAEWRQIVDAGLGLRVQAARHIVDELTTEHQSWH